LTHHATLLLLLLLPVLLLCWLLHLAKGHSPTAAAAAVYHCPSGLTF
jgi:hypothetical protein